jgi:hypothetical protein
MYFVRTREIAEEFNGKVPRIVVLDKLDIYRLWI